MYRIVIIFLLSLVLCSGSRVAAAPVDPKTYGLSFTIDQQRLTATVSHTIDSMLMVPAAKQQMAVYRIEKQHTYRDRTIDFYLLLSLCLLLGVIRFLDPHYFAILIRSFRNPSGSRHFKEQIQTAAIPNFLMNVFFAMTLGAYLYYAARAFALKLAPVFDGPMMLLLLMAGILVIYLGKYFVIRFSGWAFRVEAITEQYLFNVFLINKIIGIVLLPCAVMIAFCDPRWVGPVLIVSVLLVALLIFNRYARSWNVFGSFFQYSRFHFFTYLCASEILPMAVLLKLLLRTMA